MTSDHLERARDRVLMGNALRNYLKQESGASRYHESGHALAAVLLPNADPLHKVSIIPRGMALGVTMALQKRIATSWKSYEDEWSDAGGRMAKDSYGEVSAGC